MTISQSAKINTTELIKEFIRDKDRKSISRIIAELIFLFLIQGEVPKHYISRYLFKKSKVNINDYIPNKFLYKIKSRFNNQNTRGVLDNKLYFDFYFGQFGISRPEILMYNYRNFFVTDGKGIQINNVLEFKEILESLIKNQGSGNSVFIKKSYHSYGGNNIHKIYLSDLSNSKFKISNLFREIIKTGYLFQRTITQHSILEKFNPSCLNTIRLDTFINSYGHIEIVSGYFKTNLKNHFVDNELGGGCEISIELETGRLKKHGHMTILYNGFSMPTKLPSTKTVFENFIIPYFEESKILVIKAASYVPSLRLVGWDVAIGESGPILIEGNPDYDIPASDLAYGGYRANPVFQKALKEVSYF